MKSRNTTLTFEVVEPVLSLEPGIHKAVPAAATSKGSMLFRVKTSKNLTMIGCKDLFELERQGAIR